ncbi:hypothetical protein QO207_26600 [Pseudomonas sp. CAN2814]|uniref:hypothetical protein n=1 Tax=Pseudomonas sp. CAN1 TaxID=3046726 RepID=UPI0026495585|nr:hypothetical protein [Pseudomonas sp. CAN1]MDN6860174.1 hypothetical protein [Pseudomonas sp. CAN1]
MVVRLDRVPPLAQRPEPPRWWRWLLVLVPCVGAGLGTTLWLGGDSLNHQPVRFWLLALGLPTLVFAGLAGLRALVYLGEEAVADGWDRSREAHLTQLMRQGRRSQQVLAASLRTALHGTDNADEAQGSAVLVGAGALRQQASWQEQSAHHSRIARADDEPAVRALGRQLSAVLEDVATALQKLPGDRPLALLVETHSALGDDVWAAAWEQAWQASGIRQEAVRLGGTGLAVVDQWLDQRIRDQALLLVVACQFQPESVEGSAEAVVAVLFGNRLTQSTVRPLAYLHRPEPVDEAAAEPLNRALCQALDWVPLAAPEVAGVWKAGSDAAGDQLIVQALGEAGLAAKPAAGLHDLDGALGFAGCATPWLAVAAAVGAVEAGEGPQVICSGDGTEGVWSWCSVVMPSEV